MQPQKTTSQSFIQPKLTNQTLFMQVLNIMAGGGSIVSGIWFAQAHGFDPWILRIVVNMPIACIGVLSFFSERIRKYIDITLYIWFFPLCAWTTYLFVANHYSGTYLIGIIWPILTFAITPVRKSWQITVFLLFACTMAIGSVFFVNFPQTSEIVFASNFLVFSLVIYLFTNLRLNVQKSLQLSQDSLLTVFHSSVDALFICQLQPFMILDKNNRASAILETDDREKLTQLLQPIFQAHTFEIMREKNGKELQITTLSNTLLWMNIVMIPLRFSNKQVYLIRMSDVTEKLNREIALKSKTDDLERLNQIMTGREVKMVDMKRQIDQLEEEISKLKKTNTATQQVLSTEAIVAHS